MIDWAENEMVSGFLDGYNLDAPEPSANRSHSYRHGFANGRRDRHLLPPVQVDKLRQMAESALAADRDA